MVPVAIAAAITSAVSSVNQASSGTSIPPSVALTPVSAPLEVSPPPKSANISRAPRTEAWSEQTNMAQVHKSPSVLAMPNSFEPMHTKEITSTSSPLNSTPFPPHLMSSAFHPTATYGPISSIYQANPLGNMHPALLASPYHGIPGYPINPGNPMMSYFPSYNFGAPEFPTYVSLSCVSYLHNYGSFRPASGSFQASKQSSITFQNSLHTIFHLIVHLHHLFFIHIHGQLRHHKLLLPVTQYLVVVLFRLMGDVMVILQEYLNWQVVKSPSQESQVWKAFENLGKEMYTLTDIQRFDKNE